MSKKLTLRGATIRQVNYALVDTAVQTRVHFQTDLSRELCEEMGWTGVYTEDGTTENGWESIKLAGELRVTSAELKQQRELAQYGIDLAADSVTQFEAVREKSDSEVGGTGAKLRFRLLTTSKAADNFYGYLMSVGHEPAQLKLTLAAQQTSLPEVDTDAAQQELEGVEGKRRRK